jgi:DNA topoisomerase-1
MQKARRLLRDGNLAARAARLHYVDGNEDGIRRVRRGKGFSYRRAGRSVRDPKTLARIRRLAIPPAWENVWISVSPSSHIQATGRDARGRKQYRYHESWRRVRDHAKYEEILAFGSALPKLRKKLKRDLRERGHTKNKVLAVVVKLMEKTAIRVGNDRYTRANGSYGLTTLRVRHVRVRGKKLALSYRAKGGKKRRVELCDRVLAREVARCARLPGTRLFQYLDESGTRHPITAEDVNLYLQEATGHPFTAKEFRTWAATIGTAVELARCPRARSRRESKRAVSAAIQTVADRLGNTPSVCERSYVYPLLLEAFSSGQLSQKLRPMLEKRRENGGLSSEERAVLSYLRRAA